MNEAFKSIKNPKYMKILFVLTITFAVIGAFILKRSLSWYDLTPELRGYLRHGGMRSYSGTQLFLPSPFEMYLLDTREELWPDHFNDQYPLSPDKLPELYSKTKRVGRIDRLSSPDFEMARQRSVLQYSNHIESLKSTMKMVDAKTVENEEECSPMMQDTLFRVSRAWPELKAPFHSYIEKCQPESLHVKWDKLLVAISKQDSENLRIIAKEFQASVAVQKGEFSRWFAMEAFQWGHVMAAKIEARDKEESN